MKKYDYLIVGAGLFGAVFAHEATRRGKTCLVIDKRDHIGGNIYTEEVEGIQVHKYGAHIFHTSRKKVWDYINQFAEFNHFVNSPIAVYKDELYNLPFNMNTFHQLWGVRIGKAPDIAVHISGTQNGDGLLSGLGGESSREGGDQHGHRQNGCQKGLWKAVMLHNVLSFYIFGVCSPLEAF